MPRLLCSQEKWPIPFEYCGPQKRFVPYYPFSIVSQREGNLNSQSLENVDSSTLIARQDRQCTDNLTLRRDRATVVAVEQQYALYILSVCL